MAEHFKRNACGEAFVTTRENDYIGENEYMKKGMNKDRAFLINVMWVPLFAGVMTVALSNLGSINPYTIAVFMGVVGAAMCYLDYRVFMDIRKTEG